MTIEIFMEGLARFEDNCASSMISVQPNHLTRDGMNDGLFSFQRLKTVHETFSTIEAHKQPKTSASYLIFLETSISDPISFPSQAINDPKAI